MIFLLICSYASATSATVLMQHLAHEHRISISSERSDQKQKKLTELFVEKKKDGEKKLDEKFVFSRRILVWLCRDLLPFNVVEKVGFLDFFSSLNRKKSDIPSRTTISNMALDDMYTCLKTKLIGHLKNTQRKYKVKNQLSSKCEMYVHLLIAFSRMYGLCVRM